MKWIIFYFVQITPFILTWWLFQLMPQDYVYTSNLIRIHMYCDFLSNLNVSLKIIPLQWDETDVGYKVCILLCEKLLYYADILSH